MLFKVKAIQDLEFESRTIENRGVSKQKIIIPAGTVVDVYGVSSQTLIGFGVKENYIRPVYIIYHDTLPHFYTEDIEEFRPI